jgi:acetylornithine aminotransferase
MESVRSRLTARGLAPIDLSLGDPREPTPAFLREALAAAIPERSSYPTIAGSPELRQAIAGWLGRRFGVRLDPERNILPSNGSKEAIFHLALALVDAEGRRRRVVIPEPAYPVYERGATLAGGLATLLPLAAEGGYLPDLDAVPAAIWRDTALLWLNYPHNPTGATAPHALYDRALALARTHGFVVASDEAYAEVYFDEPPGSILQSGTERAIAFHTLSKRSAMTGFRSGFFAGDAAVVAAYRRLRPSLGVAMPEFVQAASIAAWSDDAHADAIRRSFAARREILAPALGRLGLRVVASQATFFLWVEVPGGDDLALAERWFEAGVLALPGSWLGAAGRGYLRLAMVPTLEECREAVARMEGAR